MNIHLNEIPVMINHLSISGQVAYVHDGGFKEKGTFHTYNEISLGDYPIRKIHVYIPRGYCEDHQDKRYPVVYMNDGNNTFWNNGYATYDLPDTLNGGRVVEMIVVAVEPNNRNLEYTHEDWCPGEDYGGLEEYAYYFAKMLKVWIDDNYNTISDGYGNCVVGASHGGLASFFIANKYPESFSYAACFSSSFWVGVNDMVLIGEEAFDEEISLISLLKETLTDKSSRPALWIDWGLNRDGGEENTLVEHVATDISKKMVELLIERFEYTVGEDLFIFEDPIGGHNEMAWAYRLKLFLEKFFPLE